MAFALNEEQMAAVKALRGPVLISAGAGSGKTRTLSERFVHALECDTDEGWEGAQAKQILTITFTDKAAGELAERVRGSLRAAGRQQEALDVDSAWISTIHGFCTRILRRYALEAGLDPAFSVVDTIEARRLEEEAFERSARTSLCTASGSMLFGDFEFDAVYGGLTKVISALRTRGLGAEALRLEDPRDARDIHREALAVLTPASGALARCGDSTVTTARLRERCEESAGILSEIEADRLSSAELAHLTWHALALVKPSSSTKGNAEVQGPLAESLTQLQAQAAAAAARPYAEAILELATTFLKEYAQAKAERGLLDFDDLQHQALLLLRNRPDVLDECRSLFRLSMVDEFQDTDALQLALVKAVATNDLCTVGDENQSIYGFRGADITVFRGHEASMRAAGARPHQLRENYRSHGAILEFVNALFSDENLFGAGLLRLEHGRVEDDPPRIPDDEPRVQLALVHKEGSGAGAARCEEARLIAERFSELRDRHGFHGGEMVVLVRSYTHAEDYAAALRAGGFSVVVVGGSRFLTLAEVTGARALVRAIANPRDERALLQLLAGDMGRISDDGLWRLKSVDGAALWDVLASPPDGLDERDQGRVGMVRGVLERAHDRVGRMGLSEIILRATEECGLDLLLLSRGDEGRQAYANVLKFARLADGFESGGSVGPAAFAAYLDAREEYREHTPPATLGDEESRAVRIMSVHSSKGLEFPVVAVVALGASLRGDPEIVRVGMVPKSDELALAARLPLDKSVPPGSERPELFCTLDDAAKRAEAEEGKRLLYVACTRAQEVLILSGSANFTKEPSGAELPLSWVRSALPKMEGPIGQGPVERTVGRWPVRVEVVEVAGAEEDGVSREPVEPVEPAIPQSPGAETSPALPAPERLSYSDLSLFSECAKRFWAVRVLRVGSIASRSSGGSRRLGSAVHAALQLAGEGMPSRERIEALGRYFELETEEVDQVVAAVGRFLESDAGRALAECEVVRREWSFSVQLEGGLGPLALAGAIDAYGRTGDGGLVVDYKTGTSGGGDELAERYRLQARCYALVALRDGCERVKVVFSRPQVADEGGRVQEVPYSFSAGDLTELEDDIRREHARMEAGEYPALDRWDAQVCDECPIMGTLCSVRPRTVG